MFLANRAEIQHGVLLLQPIILKMFSVSYHRLYHPFSFFFQWSLSHLTFWQRIQLQLPCSSCHSQHWLLRHRHVAPRSTKTMRRREGEVTTHSGQASFLTISDLKLLPYPGAAAQWVEGSSAPLSETQKDTSDQSGWGWHPLPLPTARVCKLHATDSIRTTCDVAPVNQNRIYFTELSVTVAPTQNA